MNKLELMNHTIRTITFTAIVFIILANMVQAPPNYHRQLKSVSREYNDEEDFASGNDAVESDEDEYIDGSADPSPTSLCRRQELEASARNQSPDNMYIPQCTPAGTFQPKQCSTMRKDKKKIAQCWCVNENGHEIPGTRVLAPKTPNCSAAVNGVSVDLSVKHASTMSPVYEGGARRTQNKNKDSARGTTKISISPVSNELTDEEMKQERGNNEGKAVPVTSLRQIGLIAGVIGGAFIGLVLAVLLVLFIVYRMRKKDEGSYALEEPKGGSPMIGYTKTSDREFFA